MQEAQSGARVKATHTASLIEDGCPGSCPVMAPTAPSSSEKLDNYKPCMNSTSAR
jgi:hypothetical protein